MQRGKRGQGLNPEGLGEQSQKLRRVRFTLAFTIVSLKWRPSFLRLFGFMPLTTLGARPPDRKVKTRQRLAASSNTEHLLMTFVGHSQL